MKGALGWAMTPVWLDMVERGIAREPIRFRIVHYFGLVGLLGACGYFASWLWLPAAAWQVLQARRRGSALRPVDRALPTVVALQILALQCLLRLTVLRHFHPPI